MAAVTQQLALSGAFLKDRRSILSFSRRPARSFSPPKKGRGVVRAWAKAVSVSNAETRERELLMSEFEERRQRIESSPTEGISFSLEDFTAALDKFDFSFEIGSTVKGVIFKTDATGAMVDINAKAPAFLPLAESCIYKVKTVEEVGLFQGMEEDFMIVREDDKNSRLILSLRKIQYDLAWERCRQLQSEDVIVKGKVVSANRGGVVVLVEGLRGFVPFSQVSTRLNLEELIDKEIPLKFMEADEEQTRLVLSNRKAMADNQAQLGIGSVVVGTVQSIKPYGAFVDLGGINGLLHVSQISHDRVTDVGTILQPGDSLKVMVLSHDRERGRVSLSTKKLEPTPGDMLRNPKLVYEKADEMAQTFRQRIAQAEAMARADMLRFQPEGGLSLSPDGILGSAGLPVDELDLADVPPAEDD